MTLPVTTHPTPVSVPPGGAPFSRLWVYYLLLVLVLLGAFFAFPDYYLATWTPLGLSSVVAIVIGVIRNRPRNPVAWLLLAAAALTLIAGDVVYAILTDVLHQNNPFPSAADVLYLLTYPLGATGILLLIRGRSSLRDRVGLIDALIITTGLGLLSWVYLVVPNFVLDGLTGFQRLASIAYPLGDILLLAMLSRLVGKGGARNRSMRLLLIGGAGLLIADVLYGLSQLGGGWTLGGAKDVGWAVFYALWGAAALHPSMVRVDESLPRRAAGISLSRIVLLASVSLIAPAVLLAQSLSGQEVQAPAIAFCSAAVFLLVIARLRDLLEVQRQSALRERILRSSSEALVAAQQISDVYQIAVNGARALIGATEGRSAAVFLARADGVSCAAVAGDRSAVDDDTELWQAAAAGGRLSPTGSLSVSPLRHDSEERGMLVVTSTAAMTLDQHDAVSTLAAQISLAVESADLAEDLRQRRSEDWFRGILQNTSDIIAIVDQAGDISYSTPSLGRYTGHPTADFTGRALADLLHPDDAVEASAVFAGFASGSPQTETTTDWRLRHRDGSLAAFDVLCTNLLGDARVGGIVLTMRDVSERRDLEVQLQHQAFHDSLTGLPNRVLLQDRAEHALGRTARLPTEVAMLILDLDDFKVINDTRGHRAGDELLVAVANRLQSSLGAGATVSRLGGDEFAVLIEDLHNVEESDAFAQRALRAFDLPFAVQGEELTTQVSIGQVFTGGLAEPLTMDELVRCADVALYAAKANGKAQVVRYDPDLNTQMLDQVTRSADLARAIDAGEFVLFYQPIVSIESGQIVSCEALIRWQHPTRGMVPPLEFIGLAEETGSIIELGRWVLNEACAQLRSWADAGHIGRVSVNVSARELQEPGFVDGVRLMLIRQGVRPSQLVLELTESIFALDAPTVAEQLRVLREDVGVKIALDDFGTGYSSLAYLQKFQLDVLKIDKSFVDGLGTNDADGSSLVSAIISLASSLRLEVIAEGIEHTTQRDELWSMGCSMGQGYLYSRPVDAEHMTALLSGNPRLGRSVADHLTELLVPATPPDAVRD